MSFHFTAKELSGFTDNIRREWAMTNGLGGYAGGSIIGACNRTHQGYLIASLHPPVDRYLVFSKTNECLIQDGQTYNLETSQHAGELIGQTVVDTSDVPDEYLRADTVNVASDFCPRRPIYTEGQRFLTDFVYDGTVSFDYEAGSIHMKKELALVQGENTIAIAYTVTNHGSEATLRITPLMNYREHSSNSTRDSLCFTTSENTFGGFTLTPEDAGNIRIVLACSDGTLSARKECYDVDMQYQSEVDNEVPGLDTHFCPYDITLTVPTDSTLRYSIVCGVETADTPFSYGRPSGDCAHALVAARRQYMEKLIEHAGYGDDDFANTLVIASDQFLAYRSSTQLKTVLAGLPWFTDWGRDTMIAFTGLTLTTKRFEEAREILKTFSEYIHHGMVPNMFPDDGQEPLYNTVDASLWYFYAVDQYLKYTGQASDYEFIQKEIYPALLEIINAYQKGTDFSIYMDSDCLIHAGSGVDQVTWMDVRVGDWVVTPRHGKPVEINALWYNALKVISKLATTFGEDASPYESLAQKVAESFCREFWNPDRQCLYDVIDGSAKDDSVRPNQIYAVSLPYTMLSQEQALSVVNVVEKELYAGPGIRSLSRDHADYHPIYCGSLPKRDAAYHQGTAWGFLMGGFISAYVKVHGYTKEARRQALAYLDPVRDHLLEGCIGSISEIFDGDAPHTCRGCYAQAWSVGEILRCYTEDIKNDKVL
jgi:predicted glycogen debranching enzyme